MRCTLQLIHRKDKCKKDLRAMTKKEQKRIKLFLLSAKSRAAQRWMGGWGGKGVPVHKEPEQRHTAQVQGKADPTRAEGRVGWPLILRAVDSQS